MKFRKYFSQAYCLTEDLNILFWVSEYCISPFLFTFML